MLETTDFATINGVTIHYEDTGDGPALVMLHAGIADLRMWDAQVPAFSQTHRVIRYDLRGFGRTAKPTSAFSHRDDLAGLLRQRGIGSAVVVGASFGGRVAIEFALEYPDMVEALVLVGSALGGYPFSKELDVFEAEIEAAYEAGDYDRAAEVESVSGSMVRDERRNRSIPPSAPAPTSWRAASTPRPTREASRSR